MTKLAIEQIGSPVLRGCARELEPEEIRSADVQRVIDDLVETMRHAGGAGLAAPQVGVLLRLFAVEVRDNTRYPYKPPISLRVLINPVIFPRSPATFESFEGCLSVPGIRGPVWRFADIDVAYLDRDGRRVREHVWGMSAGTFQHELDHLDGVLFLDRVQETRLLSSWEEFRLRHEASWLERVRPMISQAGIEPVTELE